MFLCSANFGKVARHLICGLALGWGGLPYAFAQPIVHHDLVVSINPADGTIAVEDTVHLPDAWSGRASAEFWLSNEMTLQTPANLLSGPDKGANRYRLPMPVTGGVKLAYMGQIGARAERPERGHIGPDGVYLDLGSQWYARFGDEPVTFSLAVTLPPGWIALSQGRESEDGVRSGQVFTATQPQRGIYLVANRWHRYPAQDERTDAAGRHEVLLLDAQASELANTYLAATERYLSLYSALLGPYPYDRFVMAENFWQSGLGMPGFTLLGSRVLRLPFIVHTSYPHEILHNWWGNSLYVDYKSGNWSEGLTAYLADHMLAEERGEGVSHRRTALLSYKSYVDESAELPLSQFTARHDRASAAVGYNKSLMLFHMLRRKHGDRKFVQRLREFYAAFQFKRASFNDVVAALDDTGVHASEFIDWVDRVSAPALKVDALKRTVYNGRSTVKGVVRQVQAAAPFSFSLPIVLELEAAGEGSRIWRTNLQISGRETPFEFVLPGVALQLVVDPEFDLFRRLQPFEVAPSVGDMLGANESLAVLPSEASEELLAAYREVVNGLGLTVSVMDDELDALPDDKSLWVFGMRNRYRDAVLQGLGNQSFSLSDAYVSFAGERFDTSEHSIVAVARGERDRVKGSSDDPQSKLPHRAWLALNSAHSAKTVARKLVHYGRYSYLAFAGDAARNVAKGEWRVHASPLRKVFDASSRPAPSLPPRDSLIEWAK